MFNTYKTGSLKKDSPTKTLLYAHHGFGKTYQCRFFQERYGKGLIISGESGLKSIEDVDIDYIPFTSWDGEHDPDKGVYSFMGIHKMIDGDVEGFLSQGYKWIAIDSLTEMSDMLFKTLKKKHENSRNEFEVWGDYSASMVGAMKWIRNLPVHVYVTCLTKEEKDENNRSDYWPLLAGNKVAKQVPAIFDHVFCGVKKTVTGENGLPVSTRYIVSDDVSGWHGKTRDPSGVVKPYERVDDITVLLARMAGETATEKETSHNE